MRATIPEGSTVEQIDGGWRVAYPELERHEWKFTPRPDPRDARIADLERAMQHIRQLAHHAAELVSVDPSAILETIALLAVDALAGEAQPSATVEEAMAI